MSDTSLKESIERVKAAAEAASAAFADLAGALDDLSRHADAISEKAEQAQRELREFVVFDRGPMAIQRTVSAYDDRHAIEVYVIGRNFPKTDSPFPLVVSVYETISHEVKVYMRDADVVVEMGEAKEIRFRE